MFTVCSKANEQCSLVLWLFFNLPPGSLTSWQETPFFSVDNSFKRQQQQQQFQLILSSNVHFWLGNTSASSLHHLCGQLLWKGCKRCLNEDFFPLLLISSPDLRSKGWKKKRANWHQTKVSKELQSKRSIYSVSEVIKMIMIWSDYSVRSHSP